MQLIISILFSLFLPLTPNLDFHKFYVSTTNIVYKSEKKSIQITTQLFIDDIECLLQQDNPEVRLDPDSDSKHINTILEAVLNKSNLSLAVLFRKFSNSAKSLKNLSFSFSKSSFKELI